MSHHHHDHPDHPACESCANGHEHSHEHSHEHGHEHGSRRQLWLIGITVVLLIAAVGIEHYCDLPTWQLLLVYLVPYLLIGHETLHEALEGLLEGDAMNEHFLMSVATLGALGIGFLPGAETEFPEAVFVMLFFQIGELFEGYAEGKSKESIAHLMDIRPDVAYVEDASIVPMNPADVAIGSVIVIRPGEKVPLDGTVIEGASSLNTVALTGESAPREVTTGDDVLSGCINLGGVLRVRTTKTFGESTVSKIIELVEGAANHKSQSEAFITRFARIYTPIVVYAALALALVPPLVLSGGFMTLLPTWLYRALLFLIVSCPCALVISVPLTFFGGIGGASRQGILIKGANYMDQLAKVSTVVMDKTGTLTEGVFAVEAVHPALPERYDEQTLLRLAAHVEHFSTHPIAAALRAAYPDEEHDGCTTSQVEEIAGHGITATITRPFLQSATASPLTGDVLRRFSVAVGNAKLMARLGLSAPQSEEVGSLIHVAIDGEYAGYIVVGDRIKADAPAAIEALHRAGVSKAVMLTGDRREVGEEVARRLGLDEVHAELLPADKVEHVACLSEALPEGQALAFVGDGINDAPVLARADVGIAMGALGSDAAIEAADVVLMDDQPSKVALAIRIARRTIGIAHQNVIFAIGIKVAVLLLAALGWASLWMAVFADVGVTVLAVLNAMRALRK